MVKVLSPEMRIEQVATTSMAPTVETVDPFQNVFWTSFQLYGSKGEVGLQTKLYLEDIEEINRRIAVFGPATPPCPQGILGMSGGLGMLPGMFKLRGVPFSAGEINTPSSQGTYERVYLPGIRQRLEAGLAIWRTSMHLVKTAATLNDDFTLGEGHFSHNLSDWPMRSLGLKEFIQKMNWVSVQDHIVEASDNWLTTQEGFGKTRPHYVLSDSPLLGVSGPLTITTSNGPSLTPIIVARQGNFPLKSIRPTEKEWNEPWGAQDFFERGGFIIDLNVARGKIFVQKTSTERIACAAWCRATQFTEVYPTGAPQCALPISAMTDQVDFWSEWINITGQQKDAEGNPIYDGLYSISLAPHPKGSWDRTVQTLVSWGSTAIRSLCDNDDVAAKAAAALIAFVKLQGKDAAAAQAKAKTADQKTKAAELVGKYKAGVLELTIALTVANAYCSANPERTALVIPAAELPAVEPPRFVKLVDYLLPGRVEAGRDLSPETATSPTRWSTAALIGLGLLGAAGGALAYRRKHK